MDRYLEPADTQYNEWVGTSAFDDPQWEQDEKLFGLPPDTYWILGFHLFGGGMQLDDPEGLKDTATVYVVERSEIEGYDTLQAYAREHGGVVPVTEIHTLTTAETVLRTMKRWAVTAVRGPAVQEPGWRLKIEGSRDLAEEAEDAAERDQDDAAQ